MTDIKTLEAKIAERVAFLRKVSEFAEMIASRRGICVRNEEHSAHTRTTREVKDFGGFAFWVDTGQTMYGGNDVVVAEKGQAVLHVHWQTSYDEFNVRMYAKGEPTAGWEERLGSVIENQKRIETEINAERAAAETAGEAQTREALKRVALEAAAARLMLT
jgi:hypothetical protein